MSNLRDVIDEREHAVNMLTHGTTDKIGGKFLPGIHLIKLFRFYSRISMNHYWKDKGVFVRMMLVWLVFLRQKCDSVFLFISILFNFRLQKINACTAISLQRKQTTV